MQLKKREMRSVFSKLRMRIEPTHHKIAYFEYEGIEYLKTRVSHGEGEIPKPVVERIRKQLFLNQAQFHDLIKCPMGYNEFVAALKDKGVILQ
jgi:hypothetical protein